MLTLLFFMSSGSEQEMDGEAIAAVFTTSPGPDCLKDVLPKLGQRLKVYNALKCLYEELQVRFYTWAYCNIA